jgi:outer membrane protein assembly factor BamB
VTNPILIVSTWGNGIFVFDDGKPNHELPGRPASGLAVADDGSVLAIVDGHSLCRRSRDGVWTELAVSDSPLSSCLISRDVVFVGTDDGAHLLRLDDGGALKRVESFDGTPGREKWVAGGALVDGKWMGPPLGIRSMTAACNGSVLLANVHVGGIPRSTDRGATWHPTIEVEADVHEVVCHPARAELVAAAAAAGLCMSRDGGATWRIEAQGLDPPYCSAAAFVGDEIFVAASRDHFAEEGAVYCRSVDGPGPLHPVGGGLPRRMVGIVDTAGIAAHGPNAAIVDRAGNVYGSEDAGRTWSRVGEGAAAPSAAVFVAPR